MSLRSFSSFIVKVKNPCVQCAHYIQYKYANPYDEIYGFGKELGKCTLFGKQHVVTGETVYDDAIVCRKNDSKCGNDGKFFELAVDKKT